MAATPLARVSRASLFVEMSGADTYTETSVPALPDNATHVWNLARLEWAVHSPTLPTLAYMMTFGLMTEGRAGLADAFYVDRSLLWKYRVNSMWVADGTQLFEWSGSYCFPPGIFIASRNLILGVDSVGSGGTWDVDMAVYYYQVPVDSLEFLTLRKEGF